MLHAATVPQLEPVEGGRAQFAPAPSSQPSRGVIAEASIFETIAVVNSPAGTPAPSPKKETLTRSPLRTTQLLLNTALHRLHLAVI